MMTSERERRRRLRRRTVLGLLGGALLGVGIAELIAHLSRTAAAVVVVVLCLAATVWYVRELRWSRRMRREITASLERLEAIAKGKGEP